MNEFYQHSKPILVQILSLSKDAIHIHVGFLAFIIAYLCFKQLRHSWKILLFPFTLSLIMEILDALTDIQRLGRLLIPANIHDLINTNAIPVIIFIVLRFTTQRDKSKN